MEVEKMVEGSEKYDMMGLAEALSQISESETFDEDETTMATKKTTETKKAPETKDPASKAKPIAAPKTESGMVTLANLAEQSGKTPLSFRQKLRAAGVNKPEGGRWSWKAGSKELAAVMKTLGV